MGNSTPSSSSAGCSSTSICDGGADELGLELNNDICEPMNPSSNNSSSSSESSDDESGNEQSDATTEPLGIDLRDGGASANQDTMHPPVSSGDLNLIQALKREQCLTDKEKHLLMQHSFVPNTGYSFPSRTITGSVRHFQHRWLATCNGLVYSESNGGFCKFCVLFAQCTLTMKELGVLVTRPFVNFKKAVEKLDDQK